MKVLPLSALLVLLSATVQARPSSSTVHSQAVQNDTSRGEPAPAAVLPAQVETNQEPTAESDEESSSSEEDETAIGLRAEAPIAIIEELLSEIAVRYGKKGGHGHKKWHHKKGGHKKHSHKKGHTKKGKKTEHKKSDGHCTCKKHSHKGHKHTHQHTHDKHDEGGY